jgi:hypothetical protein
VSILARERPPPMAVGFYGGRWECMLGRATRIASGRMISIVRDPSNLFELIEVSPPVR